MKSRKRPGHPGGAVSALESSPSRTMGRRQTVSRAGVSERCVGDMVDGEVVPASTGRGKFLGRGSLSYVGLMIVLVVGGFAWNASAGGPKDIHMRGAIVISRPDNFASDSSGTCSGTGAYAGIRGGSHVSVNPSSGETRTMSLMEGRLNDRGSCAFVFAGDIQVVDLYGIALDSKTTHLFQYTFIDTIGENGATVLRPSVRVD